MKGMPVFTSPFHVYNANKNKLIAWASSRSK